MPEFVKEWFEMQDLKRPSFSKSTGIPLRLIDTRSSHPQWITGGWEEHLQVIGIELPLSARERLSELHWMAAQCYDHKPTLGEGGWVEAGAFEDAQFESRGRYPVLVVKTCGDQQWLLEQNLVLSLGLLREGDTWIPPEEDYLDVARLEQTADDESLRIRAEHLRDYLCARGSGLVLATYRSRKAVVVEKPEFGWAGDDATRDFEGGGEWRGSYHEVSSDGFPFGPWAVMKMSRHDPELSDEVPVLPGPGDDNVGFEEGEYRPDGVPLTLVCGELWRNEWIEPSRSSPRVRGDEVQSNIQFIIESDGARAPAKELRGGIRWLWFSAAIVGDVLQKRGSSLFWSTEDTGGIRLKSHSPLHFGVNEAGHINVFAKDIALLPDHAQRLWAGRNITPDGRVSDELLAAQMRCQPASTRAPEVELLRAEVALQSVSAQKLGSALLCSHSSQAELLRRIHRFRCCEPAGVYALCKDLTRFFTERLDKSLLRELVTSQDNLGSLKLLEALLNRLGADGSSIMGPLFGCYDLRLADAHLPSAHVDERLALLGVGQGINDVQVGKQIIRSIAGTLQTIWEVIGRGQQI